MARLFTYGKLNRHATIAGGNHLPGTYYGVWGIQYAAGAYNTTPDNAIEFGEVVEIVQSNDKAYGVKRATSALTLATAAITLRDIVGVQTQTIGTVEGPGTSKAFSVIPASAPTGWSVVVVLAASQTPAVAGLVYVGTATSVATVAGAIYTTDVGTECVALTGWTFGGTKFTPTNGVGICAVITKL